MTSYKRHGDFDTFDRAIRAGFTLPVYMLDDVELNDRAIDIITVLDRLPVSEALRLLDHARSLMLAGNRVDIRALQRDMAISSAAFHPVDQE